MKQEIGQWHIVNSKEEMKQKALALLQDPQPVHERVIPFTMDDTVKKMMELESPVAFTIEACTCSAPPV